MGTTGDSSPGGLFGVILGHVATDNLWCREPLVLVPRRGFAFVVEIGRQAGLDGMVCGEWGGERTYHL